MSINLLLLIAMSIAALYTVMARSLLRASIGLAITSALVTVVMFELASPLAAVFELSVCAGLITVIFVSAISLTKPLSEKEIRELVKSKFRRYKYLPLIAVIAAVWGLGLLRMPIDFTVPKIIAETDVRNVMWHVRQLDIFGEMLLILAGVFGVVLLFKRR